MTLPKTFTLPLPEQTTHLTESGQRNLIRFAYTNENGEALHQFVKCRDYLGDVLWGEKWNHSITKYGFTWNPIGFDQTRTRFLLEMDKEHLDLLKSNLEELKKFLKDDTIDIIILPEELPYSHIEKKYVFIEASSYWMAGIPHISFYTFMIKLFASYSIEEILEYLYVSNSDSSILVDKLSSEIVYIMQFNSSLKAPFKTKSFAMFLEHLIDCLNSLSYPLKKADDHVNDIHNESGFMSRRNEIYETLHSLCTASPAIAA